jgi:hypothetical protein
VYLKLRSMAEGARIASERLWSKGWHSPLQ